MIEALYLAMMIGMPVQATAGLDTLPNPRNATVGAAPSSVLEIRRDAWIGNDKLRHLLMSMAATQFAYGGLRTAGIEDDHALPIAIGVAALTGVGKEVLDVRGEGLFSLKDLAWDAAGIIAAGLLLGSVR